MAETYSPPRYRVIDGTLYARDTLPYSHVVRVHELGNGHIEASVLPDYAWHEVDSLSDTAAADFLKAQDHIFVNGEWVPSEESESDRLDKLARNRERSARRAKTSVRRLVKAKSLTTMLTLTYQENMTDRARIARDFDVFVKRLRRVVPGFQYVCVFEHQKRGAWHAHIAVERVLPHYQHRGVLVRSYDLLRSMWRGVIGSGGNVDVSRGRRVGRSTRKLAAYLSKYISKGFDLGHVEGDSYRASGRALPRPTFVRVVGDLGTGFSALLDLVMADWQKPGAQFHHALLDCGGYFVSISPD